ncbi:MAG TPA: TonB-dependent receptor [Novosphingobium sp.]|nr:TonB-dependent receptor [Novosphingobium sp.]
MSDMNRDHSLRTRLRGTGLLLGVAAAALTPFCAAQAQEDGRPADAAPTVEDIVVTARRTSENLSDVPVAVTALGAQALAESHVASETDLQLAAPGLLVRQTGSSDQLNFALRGQSIDAFSFSSPAVATYFNEVPVGGVAGTSFFDFESVQVLKGPQGTLFGRNATGGAVLYSSVKPRDEFEGYLKVGVGDYDNREAEGAISIPVATGLSVRLAGKTQQRDGFQTNLLDGSHPNSVDSKVGRVTVRIAPEDTGFENVLMFQRGVFRGLTGALKMREAYGVNGSPSTYFDPLTNSVQPLITNFRDSYPAGVTTINPRVNALFSGIGDFLNKQKAIGFYDVYVNAPQWRRGDSKLFTNVTSFALNDDLTIKNVFGYNNVLSLESSDLDGSPYDWLQIGGGTALRDQGFNFGTKQWSEELQISGETGRLKYIAGIFHSDENTYSRIPLRILGDLGQPFLGAYSFHVKSKSNAIYGQVNWGLADDLNLSAGLRYTWEDVRIVQDDDSLLLILNQGRNRRKDAKPSWHVGIDYKPAPSLMLYFNHRGSWRTGGFNGSSAAAFPDAATFRPETTYDFELGAKFSGFIGSVQSNINLAIFDQHISDVQRTPYINISGITGNAKKARVSGVELDGNVRVAPWLTLGGSLTYVDARYTNPLASVAGSNFIFGPYADTPEFTGSLWFRVSSSLGAAGGRLSLYAQTYFQSSFDFSNLGDTIIPGTHIDGYSVTKARLEWQEIMGSSVTGALYVDNLTNKKYEVGGFPQGAVIGANGTLPGKPRMYGLELSVAF